MMMKVDADDDDDANSDADYDSYQNTLANLHYLKLLMSIITICR